MKEPQWDVYEFLDFLDNADIALESWNAFKEAFLKNMKMLALISGNASKDSSMMAKLQEILDFNTLHESHIPYKRAVQVPVWRDEFIRMKYRNIEDKYSAVDVFYQIGLHDNMKMDATVDFLLIMISWPLHFDLRNKHQLGYLLCHGVRRAFVACFFVFNPRLQIRMCFWCGLKSSCMNFVPTA